MTVVLDKPEDLTFDNVCAVAYDGRRLQLSDQARARVVEGRQCFERLINSGVPCYGVTTGLGKLSTVDLDPRARVELSSNILRARAAATGRPLSKPIVRSMMLLKLGNMISGLDGVTIALADYLVDRLNDDWCPWVPRDGHGMAGDATAHSHCFQTLIGEGFCVGATGERLTAQQALSAARVKPFQVQAKDGAALINGLAASPAMAVHVAREAESMMRLATLSSACAIEAMAAPKDAFAKDVGLHSKEPGVTRTIEVLRRLLMGSEIDPGSLQAAVSFRVIPQVHGFAYDAVTTLVDSVEALAATFTGNPLMTESAFLSVGNFHTQHLVGAVESATQGLIHVASLAERRSHRLLDGNATGLTPQLATRPGLDAGLVVVHKACVDHGARARMLAAPISVMTGETSFGQEDYMSMAIPASERALEALDHMRAILAGELLVSARALDLRQQRPGEGVQHAHNWIRQLVPVLKTDRPPGPDLDVLCAALADESTRRDLLGL